MSSTKSDLLQAIEEYMPSVVAKMRPETMEDVHEWARYVWRYQGFYKSSLRKSIDYFITEAELDVPGDAGKSNEDIIDFMRNFNRRYDPMGVATKHARNLVAMGTSCFTMIPKMKRSLSCSCGYLGFISSFKDVSFDGRGFRASCPSCNRKSSKMEVVDQSISCVSKETAPNACFWKIENLIVSYNEVSGSRSIYYDFRADTNIASKIKRNDPEYLFTTDLEILRAAHAGKKLVLSPENTVYDRLNDIHSDEVDAGDWGMPMFMADFESMMICILLEFYTFSILDKNLSLSTIIVPDDKSLAVSADDGFGAQDGEAIKKSVANIISDLNSGKQFIPAALNVRMQSVGGEAKSLVPIEILEYFRSDILKSVGVPAEFSNGSGNVGQLLMFSLFEKQWREVLDAMNRALNLLKDSASEDGSWNSSYIALVPVDKYNDPGTLQLKQGLFSSNAISGASYFKSMGLDFNREQDALLAEQLEQGKKMDAFNKKMEEAGMGNELVKDQSIAEQVLMQREEQAAQEQAQAEQAQGGAPQGQAPQGPPPGQVDPNMGVANPGGEEGGSIDQLAMKAEELATEIIAMDMSTRNQQLRALNSNDKILHALVKAEINKQEGDMMMTALNQQRGQGGPQVG